MSYEIVLTDEAIEDFLKLRAYDRERVRDGLALYLRHEPVKTSRSRIKQLEGLSYPTYRLRVDEIRVFYDVELDVERVVVVAIVNKGEAARWLAEHGVVR
ncbi:MAG: type II toxin-antitoxin system RelE/ParE family toxin [Planctomycetota bacterium]